MDGQDIELASQVPANITALRPGYAGSSGSAQAGIAGAGVAGVNYFGEAQTTTSGATLTTDPDFAMRLITTLIRRNRLATSKIKGLALQGVRERVQALLDQLAVERDGVRIVGEKLSQVEIASRVGASRDMISRVFKELQAEGRIRLERKQITLIPR